MAPISGSVCIESLEAKGFGIKTAVTTCKKFVSKATSQRRRCGDQPGTRALARLHTKCSDWPGRLAAWILFQICFLRSSAAAQTITPIGLLSPAVETSWWPTAAPSTEPSSRAPSSAPSGFPTQVPSTSPKPSLKDSEPPSNLPTITGSPTTTSHPSDHPSVDPSPSPTLQPTYSPSAMPTSTIGPTMIPSFSVSPSPYPTDSPKPTSSPSLFPTITPKPTNDPSQSPTDFPSTVSSAVPSPHPSYDVGISSFTIFVQQFQVGNDSEFTETEKNQFVDVMEEYTAVLAADFGANPALVETSCEFLTQDLQRSEIVMPIPNETLALDSTTPPGQDSDLAGGDGIIVSVTFVEVTYSMLYKSNAVNVSSFVDRFQIFIFGNLLNLTQDMQAAGLNITDSLEGRQVEVTQSPSAAKSSVPSFGRSRYPSEQPSPAPSHLQSAFPSRFSPNPTGVNTTVVAVVATVGVVAIALLLLSIYYRRLKREPKAEIVASYEAGVLSVGTHVANDTSAQSHPIRDVEDPGVSNKLESHVDAVILPKSLPTPQSKLVAGDALIGDSLTFAGPKPIRDEFDQYRDQNMEKMRSGIEETVVEVEGMMSLAMTKVLLDADEGPLDRETLYWGSQGDPTEIEATALSEVNDWLKREEGATIDERRGFMQETLNKMVSSVRHGVMVPRLASQTIHECAAMLGLPLVAELDETSIVVAGMRKTATKLDLVAGFKEFGEIDDAAVSSNARGFGLVRFESRKAAQRALAKFRQTEIVVQDVAVTIKILSSEDSGRPVNGPLLTR